MPEILHRALADISVDELERGGAIDFPVKTQRSLHLADLLAGEGTQPIRLRRVSFKPGFRKACFDAIKHRIERADRRIEIAQITLVLSQQKSALRVFGIEHESQVAREQRLPLFGRGDREARVVHPLVAGLRNQE